MTPHNVEHDLSLAALVVGTSKISSTSSSISDASSFRDAFNDEIIFIVSFIPTCFSSATFLQIFIWVSNLNLSRSLLKIYLHATLLKAVFPLLEEFQCNICWDKNLMGVLLDCINCRYKLYRSFFFLRMIRNVSFFRRFWVIDF